MPQIVVPAATPLLPRNHHGLSGLACKPRGGRGVEPGVCLPDFRRGRLSVVGPVCPAQADEAGGHKVCSSSYVVRSTPKALVEMDRGVWEFTVPPGLRS
jgi:hypothetical protein